MKADEIKYNDGSLTLEIDDSSNIPTLRAEGVTAHKAMFRIYAMERQRSAWFNAEEMRKLFEGVNNCTIVLI